MVLPAEEQLVAGDRGGSAEAIVESIQCERPGDFTVADYDCCAVKVGDVHTSRRANW